MLVHWRKVWLEFERWVNEGPQGSVPWAAQKRKIRALVMKHSGGGTGCPAMRRPASTHGLPEPY